MTYKDRDKMIKGMSLEELRQVNTKVICLETFMDHENNMLFEKNEIYTQIDMVIGLINLSEVNYDENGDSEISNSDINYDKYYMPLSDFRDERIKKLFE
jgi:hypothetical protein